MYAIRLWVMLLFALAVFTLPQGFAQPSDTDVSQGGAGEYEVGGPLAGVTLPKMESPYDAPAGHPGALRELAEKAKEKDPESTAFTPEGNYPVLQLRPGSPELYYAYYDKYMPVRPMFDKQSLIKAWDAPQIPGADKKQVEQYKAPLYWVQRHGHGKPTGRKWPARPVVRCEPKQPVFKLDFGTLPIGMYCIKVVGAVETEQLQRLRKPLYLTVEVNDKPDGSMSTYRRRLGYQDDFYSVSEVFFHVDKKRNFKAKVYVGDRSRVDLLLQNIELHDALAGIDIKAYKDEPTLYTKAERKRLREQYKDAGRIDQWRQFAHRKKLKEEKRLARDKALWNAWLPLNRQVGGYYGLNQSRMAQSCWKGVEAGVKDLSEKEVYEKYGKWSVPMEGYVSYRFKQPVPEAGHIVMRNKKLDLAYTVQDLLQQKPLPDPYPFKDTGAGLFYPAAEEDGKPKNWLPIARALQVRQHKYLRYLNWVAAPTWHYTGREALARDAAIMLTRIAYEFPGRDFTGDSLGSVISQPGSWQREQRHRQRNTNGGKLGHLARNYDWLFSYIKGNEELAKSIHRFVPWVKTSDDVLALIEAYGLRTEAKRRLRYIYRGPTAIADLATVQNDNEVTEPWMRWLFTRTWTYPMAVSGLADLEVVANSRSGVEYIGSTSYAGSLDAMKHAKALEPYLQQGGLEKYDLADPQRYPKTVAACYWPLRTRVAGRSILRIGDVAGPDKGYAQFRKQLGRGASPGWEWTHDPRFAWLLKHEVGQEAQSDEEWSEIEQAAQKVDRAPWLQQPSRVIPQWASILESGREHDDYRFRRTAYVRTGSGWGHHHNDTLDLQIYAHGLPMTMDGGQRPGYSDPNDRSTRVHNLVEVNGFGEHGGQWLSHNWARTLTDTKNAQYMRLDAVPPENHPDVDAYSRQVALIDVDEGRGGGARSLEQQTNREQLPEDVVTPNSYVFDVVRVSGGHRHTYCFHAALSDQLQTNARNVVPVEKADEKTKTYLQDFSGNKQAGVVPEEFTATFRMKLEQEGHGKGEKEYLGPNYNQDSGRKFTRLHLLGVEGQRFMRGALHCTKYNYLIPEIFVQKRGPEEDNREEEGDLESAYAAIIEPYAGDAFIESVDRLSVPDNDRDAQRAVAVQVKIAPDEEVGRQARTDICFADGRPGKTRTVGEITVSGEYAYYSTDGDGLRQAALTGGTRLETPELTIATDKRERRAEVVKADYWNKRMVLEGDQWPALFSMNRTFEVGTADHWTTYTMDNVEQRGDRTAVKTLMGADFYLSRVREVDEESKTVYCALGFSPNSGRPTDGIDKHWVASDEDAEKFWRAEYKGGIGFDSGNTKYAFKLDDNVSMEDFGRKQGFRLWEYGVGDTVRQSTMVNVRRVDPGVYEVTADVAVELTFPDGKTHRIGIRKLVQNNGTVQIATKQ